MSKFVHVKDRMDMFHNNFNAMVSLLHLVSEGMKSGNAGISESAEAVYATRLLGEHLEIELRDITDYMDNL